MKGNFYDKQKENHAVSVSDCINSGFVWKCLCPQKGHATAGFQRIYKSMCYTGDDCFILAQCRLYNINTSKYRVSGCNNEHEVSIEQNDTPVVTEAASSQAIEWSGPVLYANNYCQAYADKEMTQPLFTLNYNDAAQVSGMVSTSEIQVTVNDQTGYIPLSSFSDNAETPVTNLIPFYPSYHGQKTYMDYRTITSTGTYEYKLQNTVAYTNDDGIRMINGRYCIAVGTAFGTRIGQYIDLVLENGTVIHCIMGDTKSDEHTDSEHVFTVASGCCSEFIVETEKLNGVAKSGDVSNAHPEWKSAVSKVMVYNKFVE